MPIKISLLKFADSILGALLARCLPIPRRSEGSDRGTFLVIRPGGIGDAVHLTPMLRALHKRYPAARITILAEQRNAALFALLPLPLTVLRYDVPGELLRVLRSRYDVVIDTEQWYRLSACIARLVRSSTKIGYGTNERRRLFTDTIPYAHEDYEALSFLRLLLPLGIKVSSADSAFSLRVPAAVRDSLAPWQGELGSGYVVLFPGASIPERRWPLAAFRELARRLTASGRRVVVVGGRGDAVVATAIADGVALDLAGRTSLPQTAAILDGADLLVSGDSGMLHLAVALGIPTVSLFGPGIAPKWAPQGARHVVINHHLPCSPCTCWGQTPSCSRQGLCISGITVEEVLSAISKLIPLSRIN